MKKLGLVLGSSGARGVSYIGFLKAMQEAGIKADFVSGSSMGSIIGACYCCGMTAEEMEKEVSTLKFSSLIDLSLAPVKNSAFLRSNKLNKKISSYFGGKTLSDLKIPFRAVAVDVISGNVYTFTDTDDLTQAVVASCTMPSVFKPVKKDGMLLIDGGVKCRLPITQVRDLGAEVVVCLDALGKTRVVDKNYNMISLFLRGIDIMDGEITRYRLNELKPNLVLEPDLGDMSQYKFKNFSFAIEKGYELGKQNAEKIKSLINA